jgi:mRNA-degrading endonuclease RelE of RelBE toxin-antitoxin system
MENKKFQEFLSELPDDYDIQLSDYSIIIGDNEDEIYRVRLDNSITGYLVDNDNKEILFMVGGTDIAKENNENILDIEKINKNNPKDYIENLYNSKKDD